MKRYLIVFMLMFSGAATAVMSLDGVLEGDLPLPPVPPDHAPVADIAPIPDREAAEPAAPASEEPNVNVKMYRSNSYDPSLGFAPGSRYQSSEDRKAIQTPGLSLSVPLR